MRYDYSRLSPDLANNIVNKTREQLKKKHQISNTVVNKQPVKGVLDVAKRLIPKDATIAVKKEHTQKIVDRLMIDLTSDGDFFEGSSNIPVDDEEENYEPVSKPKPSREEEKSQLKKQKIDLEAKLQSVNERLNAIEALEKVDVGQVKKDLDKILATHNIGLTPELLAALLKENNQN